MAGVDTRLQQLVEDWRYFSDRIAREAFGDTTYPRRWMIPVQLNGWNGNPTDIQNMGKPFDRAEISALATAAYNGSPTGLAQAYSLQVNHMGMMERAFRARHMTPVRAMVHACGRRKAHGDTEGIWTGSTLDYIQYLADSGG